MSAARFLRRVRTMDRGELRFRSRALLQRHVSRAAFAVHRPAWQRSAFVTLVREGTEAVDLAASCARRGDWHDAHDAFMRHVTSRPSGFVLDPHRRPDLANLVHGGFPSASAEARDRAERVRLGRFDLLGYRDLSFAYGDRAIDWHYDPVHRLRAPRGFWDRVPYLSPECGDHKIIWELNRHQHWMALGRAYWLTGDRRFRAAFVEQLYSWLRDNPPLDGINWASMLELGFRSLSWIWALHFFAEPTDSLERDPQPWTVDLLVALDRQLHHIERHLSRYFSPNTHLLGEALALYVAGRTLPLRNAARWSTRGGSVLIDEIGKQINRDGGHAELSTHYHRYTLDIFLLALAVATRTQDSIAPAFADAVGRLATFARAIADERGRLPNLGDEDGGALLPLCGRAPSDVCDSLQIAAALLGRPDLRIGPPAEEVIWMTGLSPGPAASDHAERSTALRHSGYYVSRPGGGDLVVIDAGRHGYLNGGHAHADALSVVGTVDSRPLLIDPGTGCYSVDPSMRDLFRSSVHHNTLSLDGRSQAVPDGPFHWRSTVHAEALEWIAERDFDYFAGEHDGYAPAVHRRDVLSRRGCWTIVDRVISTHAHDVAVHWHIEPAWTLTLTDSQLIKAAHADGTVVWIGIAGTGLSIELIQGLDGPVGLGWCSPRYGAIVPSTTVRIVGRNAEHFQLATVVVPGADAPTIDGVSVDGNRDATAVIVATRDWTDTMVFAPSDPRWRREWSAGTLESDARVLCWRAPRGDHGQAIAMVGGTFVNDRSISRRHERQPAANACR
jgi:hypothetical protein